MSNTDFDLEELKKIQEKSPFAELNIQNDTLLYQNSIRSTCPRCNKQVKHYCYKCYNVMGMNRSEVPFVKLPVALDVIKHERESDGKTTALHARVIADQDVKIINWKDIPDYSNPERILMLYPGPDAKMLKEIPRDSFDRFIVIDGTWNQSKKIVRDTPILQKVRKVTLEPRLTTFWRFQNLSVNFLSTIEAIYYLYFEFHLAYEPERPYDGRYDNLLFYYKFLHDMIQYTYLKGERKDKKFCWRHANKKYIKGREDGSDLDDATTGEYMEKVEDGKDKEKN